MTQTNTDKTLSTERRKDIADALDDMAETLGLAKGHRSILQNASNALRAASITPPAPERSKEEVEVKALVWGKTSYGRPEVETIVGVYRVFEHIDGGWAATLKTFNLVDSHGRKNFATEAEAIAAVEADYEQRIRSVLYASPHPVTISHEEGVRVTPDHAFLHGVCDSLRAAISEYEDRDLYPGARKIMQAQIDALTAALSVKPGEQRQVLSGSEKE